MTRLEVMLPSPFSKVDSDLREKLLAGALRQITLAQLREKEEELKEARERVSKFEEKYKKSREDLEKDFPPEADYIIHEDWIEWSYWCDMVKRIEGFVQDMKFSLGEI